MSAIKNIKVKGQIFDIKATYDSNGNRITETYASKQEVDNKIKQLVGAAPESLDTLEELAQELQLHDTNIGEVLDSLEEKSDIGHSHSISDITNLQTQLDSKADKVHDHAITDITGLQTALDEKATKTEVTDGLATKADKAHNHVVADVAGLQGILDSLVTEEELNTELQSKVTSEEGKGLSTNDYTSEEKRKLQGIENNANNYVHPSTSGNKHIPSGGQEGQMLVFQSDGTAQWSDTSTKLEAQFNLIQQKQQSMQESINEISSNEDLYSYGVQWDINVSDPKLTRIGNPLLHKSLPIQSAYKGCVANGSVINYYLDPNDWSKKVNGEDSILDGTDGTVRVHIPKFYGKSGQNGDIRWVRISTVRIDSTWIEIPEMLVDAYRCTVDTTLTPKAVSVVNTTTQFRGGSNRDSYDSYLESDKFRTDLGKPRTNLSRPVMRGYAQAAGSELMCYEFYKWIFYWNYVIEYASFNCQDTYNSELTSDGYHQGGMGPGVTDWQNAETSWSGYNSTNPITPCGYCNEFGNFSGVKKLTIPETTVSETVTVPTHDFWVPRWRGFDNPFGDIWTNLDGIILSRSAANQPSEVYTTSNSSLFKDTVEDMTVAGSEIASDGYIKSFDLRETGEIIPSSTGGSASTYMCDYHWCNASSTALRTLRVGGHAFNGSSSGLGSFDSGYGVGLAGFAIGFRSLTRMN